MRHLIILLSLGCPRCEVPSCSVLILLHLDGDLGQMHDNILHLGIGLGALGTSKVVEPLEAVHDIVDNGADDDDSNGETPDNNNGDDAGASIEREEGTLAGVLERRVVVLSGTAGQETEDTEEGGYNIDEEDSTDKLP